MKTRIRQWLCYHRKIIPVMRIYTVKEEYNPQSEEWSISRRTDYKATHRCLECNKFLEISL